MFSMIVHPLNAPWNTDNTRRSQPSAGIKGPSGLLSVGTPCSEPLPCSSFLQRSAADASLLCWEVMEGRASRMELLPHSYSSSCNTNAEYAHGSTGNAPPSLATGSAETNLNEVAHGAAGLQVGAVQDPLSCCHRCQILFVSQRGAHNDVGAARVERLLV